MSLRFYNSFSKKVEDFIPLVKNEVKIYTCGPTIYNYAHIGNFRAYVFDDVLVRYLRFKGFKVTHVMNLTDVDDKTIRCSREKGQSLKEYTNFYARAFLDDMHTLNINKPDIMPRATAEIDAMVNLITALLDKDYAYRNYRGDIYFRISSFDDYGKMAGIEQEKLKENADKRLNDSDEYDKDNVFDFALWKAWDEADGDVFWDTKIGKGRPGWHIECSAMASKYLGQPFDIHAGGIDLIFPHHTNEIAQAECAYDKKFCNYWMHNGFLLIDGKKMSKSLGNFYTLRDLTEKGYSPDCIRYELVKAHYRQDLDFKENNMEANAKSLKKLKDFAFRLSQNNRYGDDSELGQKFADELRTAFTDAMDDDLNTPNGLAAIFDFMNKVNKEESEFNSKDAGVILKTFIEITDVLGFNVHVRKENLSGEALDLFNRRCEARKNKDWALADELKKRLADLDYAVKDTPEGSFWEKM